MRTYVVAELGINHSGDLSTALAMVRAARDSGVDAVKLQVGEPERYVNRSEWDTPRETPWGVTPYRAYRERLELSDDQIRSVVAQARELGLEIGVSPLDAGTVERIEGLFHPDFLKVASPKLTDSALLSAIRDSGRRSLLSTGMSTLAQVDEAVGLLDPWAVMHCVSRYPCPDDALNLLMVRTLAERYPGRVVGYSGHETGLATTVAAVALGARVVERHLTLSRAMWGSDQGASVEPEGLRRLVRDIRNVESALGDGLKRVQKGELANMRKFRLPAEVVA